MFECVLKGENGTGVSERASERASLDCPLAHGCYVTSNLILLFAFKFPEFSMHPQPSNEAPGSEVFPLGFKKDGISC